MEFQAFDINAYFSSNYGMGKAPAQGHLKIGKIALGALLIIVGIVAIILLKGNLFGIILLAAGIVAGLILMLPTIVTSSKKKSNYEAWRAEYNHRKSTWDAEFDTFYKNTVDQMNLRKTAMSKIGITEEQLIDVQPFYIYGSILNGAQDRYRTDAMGTIRADHNEITWLFFSKDQVYLYNIKFRLTMPKRTETTQEFFYTDIVSVTIGSESTSVDRRNCIEGEATGAVEVEKFQLIVPGDKMSFAFTTTDGISGSIQAMKNKIRDKKIG